MIIDIVKVFLPAVGAFVSGVLFTPFLTNYLYAHKCWKKRGGKIALNGEEAKVFNSIHKEKEVNTPRMGGIVIWFSAIFIMSLIWILSHIFESQSLIKLDFLSRNQTWIPFATLLIGSLIGLIDDYLEIKESSNGGLSLKKRLLLISIVAISTGWWFYQKLDVVGIGMPFGLEEIYLGIFFIVLFWLTALFIYAGGVIDGIDGLAGGVFATMFAAYAGIAFYQEQIDLAAFSATLSGGILAFLWFNIPPARFYMSETGSMGLTITLTVVAFMTDSLGGGYGFLVLPVIAMPLVVTVFSNILQVLSKKIRGKKIFLVAPLHHHFEAIGWPSYKVTMRYWVFSTVCAILGISLALIG